MKRLVKFGVIIIAMLSSMTVFASESPLPLCKGKIVIKRIVNTTNYNIKGLVGPYSSVSLLDYDLKLPCLYSTWSNHAITKKVAGNKQKKVGRLTLTVNNFPDPQANDSFVQIDIQPKGILKADITSMSQSQPIYKIRLTK